jgi:hypothetical protein
MGCSASEALRFSGSMMKPVSHLLGREPCRKLFVFDGKIYLRRSNFVQRGWDSPGNLPLKPVIFSLQLQLATYRLGGSGLRTYIGRSLAHTALGPAAVLACSLSAWFLAGCAVAPYTDTSAHTLRIKGTAFGGQPPVTGSFITVFATGSSGYGSIPSALGTATTDASGNFDVTSFTSCGDPEQVYIVSSGGNPGLIAGTNNDGLVLVAALGSCSSLGTSTHVIINEVTTIAAAYALSGFANLTTTPVEIGTSATNPLGLQHAFMNAANIVDFTSGSARSTTPAGNGSVPADMINTLADILEPCVNSASKTSGPCTTLFTNAKPPAVTGLATPSNTWQAALDMARYPGNNTASLFGMVLGTPSFQPTIGSTAPNDLSIGILYTAGFATDGTTAAAAPWGIAADASDNVWVTGVTNAGLIELASDGTLLSPSAGGLGNTALKAANTQQVAVDLKGNIWTVDNAATGGNIYQYTPGASTTTVTTPGSVALSGIAVDATTSGTRPMRAQARRSLANSLITPERTASPQRPQPLPAAT